MNDFAITLVVDQTPEEVFDAVNNVGGWWTENLRGSTRQLGDEFEMRFEDEHYSRLKLVEVIPNTKVVWLVVDSYLSFVQDKTEWNNTRISFEISKVGAQTQLRFVHLGLVQEVECYGACSNAWSGYVKNSLHRLITTGKGQPEPKSAKSQVGEKMGALPEGMAGKVVLVTGANRGIGRALVDEALARGASRVYAGTRVHFSHPDERVIPLSLDVTDAAQIQQAAEQVPALDVLINNAGVAFYDDLNDREVLERHLAVNLFGVFDLSRALLPALRLARGRVVNILSVAALAPLPPVASYSISKAAALSLTQSMRAYLAGQGVRVHAVLTGPVDTDMNRGFDIPKIPAEVAARNIFDGVANDEEDIFPDPMSATLAEGWRGGVAKALERQNAAFVTAQPA